MCEPVPPDPKAWARIIHDPRDASKDEFLKRDTASRLHLQGDLDLDETNSKPGEPVYMPAEDATKHSQWKAWLAWYASKYTSFIPMHKGKPANLDTLLSWKSWKASHEAARPKWRKFTEAKPPDRSQVFWRTWSNNPSQLPKGVTEGWLVGVGWYHDEDAAEWCSGEWVLVSELQ